MLNCTQVYVHEKLNATHFFLLLAEYPILWNICSVRISIIKTVILFLVIYLIKSCVKSVEILQDFIEASQYIKCFLYQYLIFIEYPLCVRHSARGSTHIILFSFHESENYMLTKSFLSRGINIFLAHFKSFWTM